jgi:hypothetical protein
MPATVSTITTSTSTPVRRSPRLRKSPETDNVETAPPQLKVKEHDFFWTYTEEPHRTRRQAIINAHPEVCLYTPMHPIFLTHFLGDQTLWARAAHEMGRPPRRLPSSPLRLSSRRHTLLIMEVLPDGIHCGCYGEPEPLPRDP